MKKQLIVMFIFIVLFPFVCAQDPMDAGEELPAGIKDDYTSAEFYKNKNPAGWIWERVDFTNPAVYQNKKLYGSFHFSKYFHNVPAAFYGMVKFDQLKYEHLPYPKLSPVFYRQASFARNLKKIPSGAYNDVQWQHVIFSSLTFNDINWRVQLPRSFHKALAEDERALQNYCQQQSGKQCQLRVDTPDASAVLFDGKGLNIGRYSVTLQNYPAGSLFRVSHGRIIVTPPANVVMHAALFGADKIRFENIKVALSIRPSETTYETKNLEGTLEYEASAWFIPRGSTAVVNNVEVSAEHETLMYGLGGIGDQEFHQLAAFFETKEMYMKMREKGTPVIFFGTQKMYAVTAQCAECSFDDETITIRFRPGNSESPGNPYYPMDSGGNAYQEFPDKLSITPLNGGGIVSGAKELTIVGKVKMENGAHTFYFDDGRFSQDAAAGEAAKFDTVNMYIVLYDNNFENPNVGKKNKDGTEARNIIAVEENNLVRYNDRIDISKYSIDARHIISEPESGLEVLRILKDKEKLDKKRLVLIIEAPHDTTLPSEKEYFDASAELLKINHQNARTVVLQMENDNDLASSDQQKRLRINKQFFEKLNEMQTKLLREKQPFELFVIGHSKLDLDQQNQMIVKVGHGHLLLPAGDSKTEYVNFNYPSEVIGSSLGDFKVLTLKDKIARELIKEGVLQETDYYKDRTGMRILTENGLKKAWPRLKPLLGTDPEVQGGLYKPPDKEEGLPEDMLTFDPSRAPVFSAIQLVKKRYPELRTKTAIEILTSPQIHTITFHSCRYTAGLTEIVRRISGKTIIYKNCKK